jgi:2-aminoadipate transaminase
MDLQLSRLADQLRASEIREILKLTTQPGMISFAGGLPALELFPLNEVRAASETVYDRHGREALQYSTTEGNADLREKLALRMNRKCGTQVTASQIQITSGSQQGLDLTAKVFLDPGDLILCESPTYIGAIGAFRQFHPRFLEVPTDEDGMIISELARYLEERGPVKLIYVIPDFQNPSGHRWTINRRREFMALVQRHGVPVIEDCPYADLSFDLKRLPSLKSMDRNEQVFYLGTFSKTFCPGLRIAWVAGRESVIRKYVLAKQSTDLHTATLNQMQVCAYLEQNDLDTNIRRICDVYRERRDVMLAAMDRTFPKGVCYTRPEGGLFLWVELPTGINARDLLVKSIEQKVAFVPGGSFFPNGGHENTLRLNFSAMVPERIEAGITKLAAIMDKMITANAVTMSE